MGSGKSTIGKVISRKSGLKFIDTDELIEIQEKMKIREIFKNKGEDFFRQIEENNFKSNETKWVCYSCWWRSFYNPKVRKK